MKEVAKKKGFFTLALGPESATQLSGLHLPKPGQILLLLLLVFPQALPGLEGGHQQTPFGRVTLVDLQWV